MNQRRLSPFVQDEAAGAGIAEFRMVVTKGFTHENKPNRNRDGADGLNRVGDVRGVGETKCEHAR